MHSEGIELQPSEKPKDPYMESILHPHHMYTTPSTYDKLR